MQIPSKRRWVLLTVCSGLMLMVGSIVAAILWYNSSLGAIDSGDDSIVRVDVKKGATSSTVGDQLVSKKLIRSKLAYAIYLRLGSDGGDIKAGVYAIKRSQSLPEIVKHLTSGKVDERSITFFPGAMIEDKSSNTNKTDVVSVLKRAGFGDDEIQRALEANYDSPVLTGRPNGASLEGYIYGETYFVAADAKPQQILQRAINELSSVVTKNDLEAKFAKRGLTLYQGITLASIVQRESIGCKNQPVCQDQRNIASVFYNRLKADMPLGSDVTYHYAADSTGQARDFRLESPYNTRIHKGLPPGPIASPGLSALNAVADPAETDYLYFLSGDDDVTYFAKTNTEHEANINSHCARKCQLP